MTVLEIVALVSIVLAAIFNTLGFLGISKTLKGAELRNARVAFGFIIFVTIIASAAIFAK